MLRIVRRGDRHDARDLTVSIRFEGEFATAFLEGRSDGIIPGETLKTFVHQIAREHAGAEIEVLGLALCRRVLDHASAGHRACASRSPSSRGAAWTSAAKPQGQAFVLGGPEQRTAAITSNGAQTAVVAGHRSARADADVRIPVRARVGPRPDDGLDDAVQALLVGGLSAKWTYSNADVTFGPYRQGVRAAITETFAMHAARSVQHTLYAIADVVLATYEEILDITLSMHERPYRPADLFSAQMENPDELFVAAEEPLGDRGSHGGARLLASAPEPCPP